jgi:hypothetical protein
MEMDPAQKARLEAIVIEIVQAEEADMLTAKQARAKAKAIVRRFRSEKDIEKYAANVEKRAAYIIKDAEYTRTMYKDLLKPR